MIGLNFATFSFFSFLVTILGPEALWFLRVGENIGSLQTSGDIADELFSREFSPLDADFDCHLLFFPPKWQAQELAGFSFMATRGSVFTNLPRKSSLSNLFA